jgi:hypothetical protein
MESTAVMIHITHHHRAPCECNHYGLYYHVQVGILGEKREKHEGALQVLSRGQTHINISESCLKGQARGSDYLDPKLDMDGLPF